MSDPPVPLANSAKSTLTVHCQCEVEIARERTGHPYAVANKTEVIKTLSPWLHPQGPHFASHPSSSSKQHFGEILVSTVTRPYY